MKNVIKILIIVFAFASCKNENIKKELVEKPINDSVINSNSVIGKVFRNISEIPELKNYKSQAGSVIDLGKRNDYKYGVSQFGYKNHFLFILEEFIKTKNNPNPKFKILDTIVLKKLGKDETISICTCRVDTIFDSEIVAIVKNDDTKEYYNRIVKAWRFNTKTKKIELINNLKSIDCVNEGFGCEGE